VAIRGGDCEAALVGGANLILAPGMTTVMTEQGVLSPDGSCKSFSADANGYARGEAVTAIFVKPLSHAIRDGNPVRAVIRSSAVNVDGKTPGMSAPSTLAHEAMIRRAYEVAGIDDFSRTAMVECHGTGTAVGDPIEANAVARVFGESGVYIGSVKPNVGHSEGASGLVSVIKSVLALEHRTIPPNIRFTSPNPAIPFESAKLTVPVEPTPWPQSRCERVSVNSFGIGGANAHVILDSAASFGASTKASKYPTTPQLLLFSANSAKSLTRMTANLQQFVEKHPESVGDLAYTLADRREHLPQRTFAISNDGVMGALAPPVKAGSKPSLVMVFTGQGAQWPQMGRELLKTNPTFQASIRSLDRYLQSIDKESPHYSIEEELFKPGKKSRLSTAELSQPLCTAVQIALVDTLKALEIDPDAVVGHSSGEIAAAYAVGALTAEEAIAIAHYRGAVASKQTKLGAMAAIGMSWTDTEKCLIPKVTIACDNSPKNVTISGDAEQVKAVVAEVSKSRPDVMARLLQVDKAYHSYHMAEVGDYYRSLIGQKMVGKAPTKLFFSSVSGKLLTEEENLDARYWQTNLESPVRFREAVAGILKHEAWKNGVFLEIGPHSALAGPLRQIFTQASSSAQYVSAMIRNQNAIESLLTAIGKLYLLNVPIDLKSLIPNGSCLPDLPRYPWNHEDSYWYESRVSMEWRSRKHAYHDLLGVRVAESSDLEPVWRNLLHLQNAPWIRDHKVGDDIVYPFAGYIALAGEAIRQLSGVEGGFSLQNIIVGTALVLPEGKPTEIVTTFRPRRLTTSLNSQWWEFTVASYNGHAWTKHCTGEVSPLSSDLGPTKEPEALPRKVGPRKWYETMRRAGLDLGPAFQNLETVDTSTDSENKATGKVVNGRQGDEANYHIHPTVIDGTLQLLGAASVNGYSRKYKNWLPTIIEKVNITRCLSDMVSSVSAKATGNSSVVGEGRCTSGGKTVLEVSGIRISLAEGSLPSKSADDHAAGRKEWSPDLDFMDFNELITLPKAHAQHLPLLNELGQLCLLSSSKANNELGTHLDHIRKYKNWIESQTQSIELSAISSLDDDTVSAEIQNLVQRLSNTPASAAANALYRVCTKSNVLMSGKPLEEVISNDVMTDLYSFIDKCDRTRFIQNLGHFKPNLRVLEIGAGRGSLASHIVKELTLDTGKVCCSKYTLTTTAFVNEKDQQKIFDAMEYATLDISENLAEQNFEGRQYDLIIITNGLHACKSLHTSLINIKKLLHPDGRLLLQEICPSSTWVKYIFAISPSFWIGDADGRPNEPYVGAERWESELSAAGFGALDALVQDQLTAVMVARLSCVKVADRITVLCPEQSSNRANQLLERLEKEGYELDRIKIEDHPPAGQDVISVLDLDGPFFHDINAAQFQAFKEFLSRLGDSGVMWITEMCQMGCKDPRYGQTFGLVRNIRSEKQLHFATCEVDDFLTSSDEIVKVFNKFHSREENDKLKPDFEYCIRNGEINIGRVYPVALKDELLTSEPTDKVTLDVGTPGRLNTLHWSRQAVSELQSDQVEIEVCAVGLNFRVGYIPVAASPIANDWP
jgi:acyl transferase domain-containing protein